MDLETPRVFPWGNRSLRSPKKSIVLDPGHGGYDGGATGHGGLLEKDVTLDLAKQVKVFLESRYPVIVSLTREDDTFVPLARRTSFANKRKADAFVSIHLNASPSHNLHGLEAYYLDTADDEASRKLAERENGLPEGAALDDLSFILSDLIQSGKLEGSIELAHALEAGVVRAARPIYKGSRSYGVKKGPFFVLVGAHMPCSLLEVYFVDSPADGPQLASSQFRTAAAEGIGMGLIDFLLPGKESTKVTPVKQKKRAVTKKTKRVRRA
jgi:N-acetylmuramoyl-L-alanine amidase